MSTPGLRIPARSTAALATGAGAGSADASATDTALDGLARSFARAMSDPQLREATKSAAMARFDGDTEVLYGSLASRTLPGGQAYLDRWAEKAAGLSKTTASAEKENIQTLAPKVPRLQVAVRGPGDSWATAAREPLVTYAGESLGAEEQQTVTAYDSTGGTHTLNLAEEPAEPVIVLGVNERTDDTGTLLPDIMTADENGVPRPAQEMASPPMGPAEAECGSRRKGTGVNPTGNRPQRPRALDPGQPELWLRLSSPAFRGGFYLGSFSTSINLLSPLQRNLFGWGIGIHGSWVMWYWYEQDGGHSINVGINWGAVHITIPLQDGDDRMGYLRRNNLPGRSTSIARTPDRWGPPKGTARPPRSTDTGPSTRTYNSTAVIVHLTASSSQYQSRSPTRTGHLSFH